MEENNEVVKLLLGVSFDQDKGIYGVHIARGSNVPETAFSISVVIKCLLKDGIIKSADEVLELVQKYLNDPQYDELKDTEEANEQ